MKNLRKYGERPFSVAVIHGGPGASGGMAPVARELARICGILEPLQTAASISGQIQELKDVLQKHGDLPVTLIGHSWGAWLSFIFGANNPALVKKLILISSGPFEAKYASKIMATRLSRLNEAERLKVQTFIGIPSDYSKNNERVSLAEFGELMAKTDSFAPLPLSGVVEKPEVQEDIYRSVWPEAAELRRSGGLLQLGKQIRCPVLAIHGDYDPHPYEGVAGPLARVVKDFRFILLKDCGHEPWIERNASDKFYEILREEVLWDFFRQ